MTPQEFRDALSRLGWSQAEFSRRSGITVQSVNYWAQGNHPIAPWAPAFLEAHKRIQELEKMLKQITKIS